MTYPAYATATDVQSLLSTFTSTPATTPNTTQIAGLLGMTAGEIDTALKSRGYAVPVTAPAEFVAELNQLNAMGAAAWVAQLAFPATQAPDGSPLAAKLSGNYQARLTEIREGIGVPVGLERYETDLAPRSYVTDTGAYGQPNDAVQDAWGDPVKSEPLFTVGKRW